MIAATICGAESEVGCGPDVTKLEVNRKRQNVIELSD